MALNLDEDFFTKKLSQNGFKINKRKVLLQKDMLPGLSYNNVSELFNNNFLSVLFVKTVKMTKGSVIRAARHYAKQRPTKNLLVFSNNDQAILVMFPNGPDGPARILHLEDKLYHTDEEALSSIRYADDITELSKLVESYLPYEKVRDDFFNGYRERYQSLVSILKKHGFPSGKESEYAQRFLGRLMFLYFLQKKGWLAHDKDFINTIGDYRELNEVFYNGLNNPDNRLGLPYLNGSLFDKEDYLTESVVDSVEKDTTSFFTDVRSFFNRYNFTVDESSSLEKEVSIDPYLLGTVFENMLPENERGSKGTFYTPPAEISFIIRRAISNYLTLNGFDAKDEVSEDGFKDGISRCITELKGTKNPADFREFREKLQKAVVVDPAVGSGGFLVLYMDEVVRIINDAEIAVYGEATPPKLLKEEIIGNIYGFDIENEAVEIARLRMWLSYVIDEDAPRPLPNLDLNIASVDDSLTVASGLAVFDEEYARMRQSYLRESDKEKKKNLKKEIADKMRELVPDLDSRSKANREYIESHLINKADIVVMNPPYVRQESIDSRKKEYYAKFYSLDRKSDIYTYFFIRAVQLLKPHGVVSVISSDKWLETWYGRKLQEYLRKRLIAVYGQSERSFGADINTVISVFTCDMLEHPVDFTYLDSYSSGKVRRNVPMEREKLQPGKWFYLRAPKIFMEKIFPKLTHKLGDFAEIKRGFTTGANEFFYMKDVSSQYEADYIANPKKFEEWGVTARNEKELKEQGLIYIENEGGERFVIDSKDVKFLVRTTKELNSYVVEKLSRLCLYTKDPGIFTKKYIDWGEKQTIHIKGRKEPIIGYNNVPSVSGRKKWYSLNDLEPSDIILPMYVMDRFFIPVSETPMLCDHTLYTMKSEVDRIGAYLNSTIFYMTMELYLRRLGGGVGEIMVDDYLEMPVPDLNNLKLDKINFPFRRDVKRYYEEIRMEDRKKLDEEMIKGLSINISLEELYNDFIELVEDRLIKADRPLKSTEEKDDEDN